MSLKNKVENETGIYKLGFNLWSFLGIAFPIAFTVLVGGLLALLFVF